jgi:hypothetical protein
MSNEDKDTGRYAVGKNAPPWVREIIEGACPGAVEVDAAEIQQEPQIDDLVAAVELLRACMMENRIAPGTGLHALTLMVAEAGSRLLPEEGRRTLVATLGVAMEEAARNRETHGG